jgi:hypothetical protein
VSRVHDDVVICVADTLAEQLAGCVACRHHNSSAAAGGVTRAWFTTTAAPHHPKGSTYHRKSAQSPCWRFAATAGR